MKILLADRLRSLRGNQTQAVFANKLGILQQTYARYEQGIRSPPFAELANIAIQLGVTTDWLLGLSDNPRPAQGSAAAVHGVAIHGDTHNSTITNGQPHSPTVEQRLATLEAQIRRMQRGRRERAGE